MIAKIQGLPRIYIDVLALRANGWGKRMVKQLYLLHCQARTGAWRHGAMDHFITSTEISGRICRSLDAFFHNQ